MIESGKNCHSPKQDKAAREKQNRIDEVMEGVRKIEAEEKKVRTLIKEAVAWPRVRRLRGCGTRILGQTGRSESPNKSCGMDRMGGSTGRILVFASKSVNWITVGNSWKALIGRGANFNDHEGRFKLSQSGAWVAPRTMFQILWLRLALSAHSLAAR